MSPIRQQRRAAERLELKRQISSDNAQARGRSRAAWKEAWDHRFRIERTSRQSFLFFLTSLLHVLGSQYHVWKRFGEREPKTVKKKS